MLGVGIRLRFPTHATMMMVSFRRATACWGELPDCGRDWSGPALGLTGGAVVAPKGRNIARAESAPGEQLQDCLSLRTLSSARQDATME